MAKTRRNPTRTIDQLIGEELRLRDPDRYVELQRLARDRRPISTARAEQGLAI